ncbi:MAG: ATP-binding domain-containing protein, partial [Microthrixaceae bacterium]|nr:ATP-binding domain-containing protein [Microthrixaceae bacterium]
SALMIPPGGEVPPASSVADGLSLLLAKSGYLDALRASRDPQDEARVENLEEFVVVAKDFARTTPDGTLIDFLTDVALVAAADEIDDSSGVVSLMTLHTAKGLEFDTVFVTGVEEELIPHRISAGEPGGPAEERRLFYVGITRARQRLYLTLAMTRAQFGEVSAAMPSRFLQEIPAGLIDWRQTPGDVNSRGGTRSRALNSRGGPGSRTGESWGIRPLPEGASANLGAPRRTGEFPNRITAKVRDNGDLTLEPGDRIRHDDFGEGRVDAVTGEGAKRVAHVRFDTAGAKKLLIKIAPIAKI